MNPYKYPISYVGVREEPFSVLYATNYTFQVR